MRFAVLVIALHAFAGVSAYAVDPVTVLHSRSEAFMNTDCAGLGICRLRSFSIQVDQYAVTLSGGDISFGTRMNARYETEGLPALEDFGIAQFIRGCQYSSRKDGTRTRDVYVPWRNGENVPYYFPQRLIDGPSPDPLDWGFEPMSSTRHYYYWWNEVPGSIEPATGHYFGEKAPTNPALYVRDLPGTAFYDADSGEARNISLHFRTCLYRTDEVPTSVPPDQLEFAKAIHCFDWTSSWIYDHETGIMESPADLVEFCR